MIFGKNVAKTTKLGVMHLLSTSSHLCQRTTVLNVDAQTKV